MKNVVNEFEYTLTSPLSVHKDGGIVEAYSLLLKAPTNAHRYQINKIKQGFMRAIKDLHSENDSKTKKKIEKETEEGISADQILAFLTMSNVDLNEIFSYFKDLICNRLCFIDGKVPMNAILFDQLSIDDGDMLLGKYLEVFIVSSLLASTSKV